MVTPRSMEHCPTQLSPPPPPDVTSSVKTTPLPVAVSTVESSCPPSVSHSKLQSSAIDIDGNAEYEITGNRIIDMDILSTVIKNLICPECKQNNVSLREILKKKKGLASYLIISCICGYEKPFYTSKQVGKSFDINKRAIYSMRSCGQGYAGLEKFLFCMNMPKPMTRKNYTKLSDIVAAACQKTALETMLEAATDLQKENIVDVPISADGSWQRRGYSSMNGFVSAISMDTGKIVDIEPMSRFCKVCSQHQSLRKSNPKSYEIWKARHAATCKANYKGSAPNMEVEGAKRIFSRSECKGLRYTKFFADGDSKTFPAIEDTYMFGENPVKVLKRECVGHVQKRVGNRLRKKKKIIRGLGGKGKLTETMIDRLQNYYGIAIRSNKGDLEGMKKSIFAALFHVASSAKNIWHDHCPTGKNSWCKYQQDIAEGTTTYQPGIGLPLRVIAEIKPIFVDLSDDKLLGRCLDCYTQNQNECFNNYVWRRIPKETFVGFDQFKFGLYDAVGIFNIGRKATLLSFDKLNIEHGKYTVEGCYSQNSMRLYHSKYKNAALTKTRRKIIRGNKKLKTDTLLEQEGPTYGAGEF